MTNAPSASSASDAPPTQDEIRLALRRLSRARTVVVSYCRFFGHLVLRCNPVIAMPEHGVDTAAVAPDGTTYFNAKFISTLSDAELAGLVVHEAMHPALLCWRRQGNRDAMVATASGQVISLWNLAHDLSFNPEIEELAARSDSGGRIRLPAGGALNPAYKGMSAEQIYAKLLAEAEKNPKISFPGNSGRSGDGQGRSGNGQGKSSGRPVGQLDIEDGLGDDLRPDLSQTETGKQAAAGDKLAQQKLDNDWRVAIVAAAIAHERKEGRGSLPAGFQKLIDSLQTSKVEWREVLSKWIGEKGINLDFTYRRPSRRSESAGSFLPSYQRYGIDDVVVLWDTSGSMNGRETDILSEVNAICEDLGLVLRIICCDAAIHSDTHDVRDAIDMAGKVIGGGGSDFMPAFNRLEDEQYEGVVVAFTDGHISVPNAKPPLLKDVLWCITSGGDQDPTGGRWGTVLVVDD